MDDGGQTPNSPEPITIDDIGEISIPLPTDDDTDLASRYSASMRDHHIVERERLTNANIELDYDLRSKYVPKLFWLVCGWLCFVSSFVYLASCPHGTINVFGWFYIVIDVTASDKLLITMLATTTATIVGLFTVVATWMFPKRKGRDG